MELGQSQGDQGPIHTLLSARDWSLAPASLDGSESNRPLDGHPASVAFVYVDYAQSRISLSSLTSSLLYLIYLITFVVHFPLLLPLPLPHPLPGQPPFCFQVVEPYFNPASSSFAEDINKDLVI